MAISKLATKNLNKSKGKKKGKWLYIISPQMRHILVSLNSVASAADRIQRERLKNQVASVRIRTQTSVSSLDQLVCPGD